jgi:hypothetical protein
MAKNPAAGGGITITGGTVGTGGGDIFVGNKVQFISAKHIDDAFRPIAQALERTPPEHKAAAEQTLHALKNEAAKGKDANDSIIAKLLEGLVGLVPGAVSAVVGAFASPLLSGIAGPVTKYVLEKLPGK